MKTYLKVKDYSVSGEEFYLLHNEKYDMLETFPKPSNKKLPEYYNSDDYISHSDSSRNLFEKAYHFIRSISLKRKVSLINSCGIKEKHLLDVGCGTGDFLELAKQKGWTITGIEPNPKAREIANLKTDGLVFDAGDLLNFKKHSFDVITLWHVLEHLPELEKQISIFKSLLKHDGTLVVAVPNYNSYDAKYYKVFWAAYDVPRHLWHFSKMSISNLFAKQKMRIKSIEPLKFDAFYVSLLSEKYKSGWMNVFNAMRVGLFSNIKAKKSGEYSSLIYIIKNT